jgi:hypothetical protein
MARIIPLRTHRARPQIVYFSRRDLQQLLGLFSRHVQARQWLDYSIDNDERAAVFCVYRRAHDAPLYRIYRLSARTAGKGRYLVMKGPRRLAQSNDLKEALQVFAPPLRVVASESA